MGGYILALDEGTTSARAMVLDGEGSIVGAGQYPFKQIYPEPGWVEHDPSDIWGAQLRSVRAALKSSGIGPADLAAVGIANQRETTVVWEKGSGRPLHNAIVWQCRRTADAVETLKREHCALFKDRTGLVPDSYFSGPKASWLLENVPGLRERALGGEALFGTVDSYLIYRLTGGRVYATDYSNASRTLMFDIHRLDWDEELLEALGVPGDALPEALPSSALYGYTDQRTIGASVPICGVAGDQQAALFGHTAFTEGDSKCTYGTGNFLLMNTGTRPRRSGSLLTTVAWGLRGGVNYALEGSIFVTGAAVQWLRDTLGVLKSSEESETLASTLKGNEGVYFVPALTGLGAPYWDQYARGAITGITRGTGPAQLARATLESIAYLTRDVVEVMVKDSGIRIGGLRVDGGASRNGFLMQFQSDVLGIPVIRPADTEATARGAAYLAGLSAGVWSGLDDLKRIPVEADEFTPKMSREDREKLYEGWRAAVRRVICRDDPGMEDR